MSMIVNNSYSLKKVRGAVFHFLKGKTIASLGGLLFQVLIAREVPIKSYAIYTIVFGLINIIGMLSSLGLRHTVQRYLSEYRATNQATTGVTVVILCVRMCLLLIFCLLFDAFLDQFVVFFGIQNFKTDIRFWIPLLGLIVFYNFEVIILDTYVLQRVSKWISILLTTMRLSGLLYLIYFGDVIGVRDIALIEFVAYGLCAAIAIAVIVYNCMYEDRIRESVREMKCFTEIKRIVFFSSFNYLRELVYLFSGQASNRLSVAKFLSVDVIATFGFAAQLSEMVQRYLPAQLLRNLLNPFLLSIYVEDRDSERLNSAAFLIFKTNLLILLPVAVVAFLFGDHFLLMLSGDKYAGAGWILTLLLCLLILNGHTQILQLIANATEHNYALFKASIVNSLFVLPAVWATYSFGVFGLLLSRGVGVLVSDMYLVYTLRTLGVGYGFDFRGVGVILSCCLIPGLFLSWALCVDMSLLTECLLLIPFMIANLLLLYLINPFNRDEMSFISKLISGKSK